MRTLVMMLALSLIIPVGVAAQTQTQSPAPAQAGRHTLLPPHKARLSIDFGAKEAAKRLSQFPIRCDTVQKHRNGLSGAGGFVELPIYGAHHRITTPASPCPVR